MTDNPAQTLNQAMGDYLHWMSAMGYLPQTCRCYRNELNKFFRFVTKRQTDWDNIFSFDTLNDFQKNRQRTVTPAVRGLWRYLFEQQRILKPLRTPHRRLPDPYEDYLSDYQKTRQVPPIRLVRIRRVLCAFHDFLEKHNTKLVSIRIEHIDAFLSEFFIPFSPGTRHTYRFYLRGFLKYLYYPRRIIRKNLAPLLTGAPQFGQNKPPKFMRPHEVQRLFDSFTLSSSKDLRNYAMVHLAYYLGLRPDEISCIRLNDISFVRSELTVTTRKNDRPAKLPVPENIMKVIAAYIIGARRNSNHRRLFLNLSAPYRPISANMVGRYITWCIRKAGLSGTAYWLRHSYAQNLLEAGSTIYEIKEMMGHESIDAAENYLHIHIKLMRKVIFDEEF